jgi:nucleotide-binding universal stress UspA family protein
MVAIDGSQDSFKAAEYALGVAKSFGAQLYAVTVTYESKEKSDSMNEANIWFQKFDQDAKEKNVQLKTELINKLVSWPLVPVPIEYVLCMYAEKEKVDLIVLGTRGQSGFKKLLLGSVASGVVKYAHCPVMVVK